MEIMMVSTLKISRILLDAKDMEELRKGAVLPVKLPDDALVEILCTDDACGQGGGGSGISTGAKEITAHPKGGQRPEPERKYFGKGEVEQLLRKTMESADRAKTMSGNAILKLAKLHKTGGRLRFVEKLRKEIFGTDAPANYLTSPKSSAQNGIVYCTKRGNEPVIFHTDCRSCPDRITDTEKEVHCHE